MADRTPRGPSRPTLAVWSTVLIVVLAVTAIGAASADAESTRSSERPLSHVGPDRVLVLSLPRITWADVLEVRPTNLLRLLDRSAVASSATRSIGSRTSLAEGYLTLGAGNRAAVDDRDGALAFAPDEPYGATTAGAEYERRTGHRPAGQVVQPAIDDIISTNDRYRYGTEPGALAEAVGPAQVAVIGNADTGIDAVDRTDGPDGGPRTGGHREPSNILADDPADAATAGRVQRAVALGLIDADGTVRVGDVSHDLLESAPGQPFGVQQDEVRTLSAFDRAWRTERVVLVEAGDLERADAAGFHAGEGSATALRRRTLRHVDRLIGELLDRTTDRDLVLVASPAAPRAAEEPTPFAISGRGVEPGIATSGTTRRSGYVALTDVAPTILDHLGLDAPDSMSGAPISIDGAEGSQIGLYEELADRNEVTAFRDHAAGPISIWYLMIQIAAWCLVFLGTVVPLRWIRWARPVGGFLALVSLAFPTVTFLFGLGRLDGLGRPGYGAALTAVAVLLAAFAEASRRLPIRLARWRLLGPPLVLIALLWLVLVLDGLTGTNLQINTIFGYSPVVAGRFAGYGNMAFALLGISGVVLAAALPALAPPASRLGRTESVVAVAAAVLGATILVDGFPAFGSDVGGVLCLVPASAVVLILLGGRRPSGRTLAFATLAVILAVAAFVAYDLSRPASEQSHLGRFVSSLFGDDTGASTTLARKADAAWATLRNAAVMWVVPIAIVVLVVALVRRWGFVGRFVERIPGMLACLWGAVVLGVLGGALNDSGVWVPAMMVPIVVGYLVSILVAEPATDEGGAVVGSASSASARPAQVEPST